MAAIVDAFVAAYILNQARSAIFGSCPDEFRLLGEASASAGALIATHRPSVAPHV